MFSMQHFKCSIKWVFPLPVRARAFPVCQRPKREFAVCLSVGEFEETDAKYFLYDRRDAQVDIPVFSREDFASVLLNYFVRAEIREIFFESGITETLAAIETMEDVEEVAPQLFDALVPEVSMCVLLTTRNRNTLCAVRVWYQSLTVYDALSYCAR